jgi:kinesin family protein C1
MSAADEIDALKRRYTKEIADLECDLRAKDRLLREKEEDLRLTREDLERERQTISTLKNTIAQHSNTQIALESHNASVLAQNQLLQAQLDSARSTGGNLALELERCKAQLAELEQESRDHEAIRRRLHNQSEYARSGT